VNVIKDVHIFAYLSFILSIIPWAHILLVISHLYIGNPNTYTSWLFTLFLSPVLSMVFGIIGLKGDRGKIFSYFGIGISVIYSFIIGSVAFVAIYIFGIY